MSGPADGICPPCEPRRQQNQPPLQSRVHTPFLMKKRPPKPEGPPRSSRCSQTADSRRDSTRVSAEAAFATFLALDDSENPTAQLYLSTRAARRDAAKAAFDRKFSHRRREIGFVCRRLVWTAGDRPHPAVTRTLQYAADIASCRNGQQMPAKALHHRWKHEVQIALLWRRAAMNRAVLPNMSLLLAGLIDRAASHCVLAPPLHSHRIGHHSTRR